MAYNYEYPYTDTQRYNDDWLLSAMKRLEEEWKIFIPTHDVKFGGEWNGTLTYGAYTIVSDSNLNSYISTKAVPAGIQISNTDYWVKIGDYNAQLYEYKNQTDNSLAFVNTKSGSGIGVFIGDSYSDRTTGYTKALPDIIGENLKLSSVRNYAVGGAGYVNGIGTNQHFGGQLNRAISDMSDSEKNQTSYVFILGGQNDYAADISQLLAQYSTIFANAKTAFPNAQIVVLPLWYNRALSAENTTRFTLLYYYAFANGCKTDSLSWNYLINPTFTFMDDGIHPTQTTLNVLGGMISSLVLGGNPRVPAYNGAFTKQANISASNSMAWFDGENVHLHYVASCSASTIPVGTNIGAFDSCFAPPVPVIVKCPTGSGELQVQIGTNGIISTMTQLTQNEVWLMDVTYPLHHSPINSL